ncbi:MAG: hypothetical protein FJY91_01630 [Candidatus Harrisonbacteria bacterium]|nr:hypothetical protein [Candidatus Harrisonbacteria bacterium]
MRRNNFFRKRISFFLVIIIIIIIFSLFLNKNIFLKADEGENEVTFTLCVFENDRDKEDCRKICPEENENNNECGIVGLSDIKKAKDYAKAYCQIKCNKDEGERVEDCINSCLNRFKKRFSVQNISHSTPFGKPWKYIAGFARRGDAPYCITTGSCFALDESNLGELKKYICQLAQNENREIIFSGPQGLNSIIIKQGSVCDRKLIGATFVTISCGPNSNSSTIKWPYCLGSNPDYKEMPDEQKKSFAECSSINESYKCLIKDADGTDHQGRGICCFDSGKNGNQWKECQEEEEKDCKCEPIICEELEKKECVGNIYSRDNPSENQMTLGKISEKLKNSNPKEILDILTKLDILPKLDNLPKEDGDKIRAFLALGTIDDRMTKPFSCTNNNFNSPTDNSPTEMVCCAKAGENGKYKKYDECEIDEQGIKAWIDFYWRVRKSQNNRRIILPGIYRD